jgi:hypothetical protein
VDKRDGKGGKLNNVADIIPIQRMTAKRRELNFTFRSKRLIHHSFLARAQEN